MITLFWIDDLDRAEARRRAAPIWETRKTPSLAQQTAYAALQSAARRSVAREVKMGARRYALCSCALENVEAGLSSLTPSAMSRRVKHLLIEEIAIPRGGWIGGLTPALNLKSALLYARWSRVVERSIMRRRASHAYR